MLRVLIQFNLENEDYESGEVSLGGVFIDTDYIDKEQALDLEVDANGLILSNRQVVFGSEAGESILGGNQADRLYGMGGGDWITGGEGKDYIEGGDGEDTLEGGEGKDVLKGGRGRDYIEGGAGDDILIEGQNAEFDMGSNDLLKGGEGFDTYIVGAGDIVEDDAANEGKVHEVNVSSTSAAEKAEEMTFAISLSRTLREGESLTLNVKGETFEFNSGTTTQDYTYEWQDNERDERDRTIDIEPTIEQYIDIEKSINLAGEQAKDKVSIEGGWFMIKIKTVKLTA